MRARAGHAGLNGVLLGNPMDSDDFQRRNSLLEMASRQYRTALRRFFVRRAPALSDEADDLTQEVFLRLARREGEAIERPEGYIFQAAANVLTDRVRRRAVRHARDHVGYEEHLHAVEDFSPERVLIARQQIENVRSALNDLPERVRAAFVLHRFEELTYPEIAARLGVSVSSVEKYIMRALKEISAQTKAEP